MRHASLALFALACSTEAETDEVCDTMCQELVMTCEYAAYPSYESCVQGCAFSRQEGGNVKREADCIAAAECDTFAIVDCEHQWGQDAATGDE